MITDHLITLIAAFLRLAIPSHQLQLVPSRDAEGGWWCGITNDDGAIVGLSQLAPDTLTERLTALPPRSAYELSVEERQALEHLLTLFTIWAHTVADGSADSGPALVFRADGSGYTAYDGQVLAPWPRVAQALDGITAISADPQLSFLDALAQRSTTAVNLTHAAYAYLALECFAEVTGLDLRANGDGVQSPISDLLACLMHLCRANGLAFENEAQRARELFYEVELAEELAESAPRGVELSPMTVVSAARLIQGVPPTWAELADIASASRRHAIAQAWSTFLRLRWSEAAYAVLHVNDEREEAWLVHVFDQRGELLAVLEEDALPKLPVPHSSDGIPSEWLQRIPHLLDGTDPVLIDLIQLPPAPRAVRYV